MNKKYITIGGAVVVAIVCIFAVFKMTTHSFKDVLKDVKNYKSYELVCSMDMLENDELKSYQVTTTYGLVDENAYYKVELYDKSLNQSQVIVRNADGVFVLTPSLNQAFQFKSEWPNNSPKPYLYESLIEFLENNKVEKVNDGYIVTGDMVYENDDRIKTQEVKFDKELNPLYVNVYDADGTEIIKVTVTEFTADKELTADDFSQEAIMKATQSQYSSVSASLPLYPVALLGSTLENEKVSTINDTVNHILKFTGDKTFTIIETALSSQNDINVEVINAPMIDLIDGVAYQIDNQMTYITSGIVCSLYSNDLSSTEMIAVLSSMQASNLK